MSHDDEVVCVSASHEIEVGDLKELIHRPRFVAAPLGPSADRGEARNDVIVR